MECGFFGVLSLPARAAENAYFSAERTEIAALDAQGRKAEIVRLLGGEGSGAAATLADELLASCAAYKEQEARKK